MKEKIRIELMKIFNQEQSVDSTLENIMVLVAPKKMFSIQYYNTYSIFDRRTELVSAENKEDALNKFWVKKDKEGWQVSSVTENDN